MFANIIFQYFTRGGPVMWPILACALTAVAVVGERTFWWWRESLKGDLQKREGILGALENSEVEAAKKMAEGSGDPVVRMIHHSLSHVHSSIPVALQMAAGIELERAGRFLNVMDTLVTLAPLLGLLGTVTGLMRAFLKVGSAELAKHSSRRLVAWASRSFPWFRSITFRGNWRGCSLNWRRSRAMSRSLPMPES